MAINYVLVQRRDMSKGASQDAKLFYAQSVSTRNVHFNDLCEEIAETCTLTSADIKAVLDRMIWVLVNHLKNSEVIEFADLGNFRISASSKGSPSADEFTSALLRKPRVIFHPGKRLQEMRTLATYNRADKDDSPSGKDDVDDVIP